METLQSILKSSGHNIDDLNNRQRAVRSLNHVLKNSNIKLKICDPGKVWSTASGFKYNVSIGLSGYGAKVWKTNDFSAYNFLLLMGKFLQIEAVRKIVDSDTETPYKCMKCEGKGIIPQFYYYANGVCFDCLGCGSVGKLSVKNVSNADNRKGIRFVNQFYMSANYIDKFPKGVEYIKSVNNVGHPTAEFVLGKKDDFFYVHQPVCKGNGWYEIPSAEFDKFKNEYNFMLKKEAI
ncbi:MAG: hypothetical protein V4547_17580 [Bacteroidota bacterium]